MNFSFIRKKILFKGEKEMELMEIMEKWEQLQSVILVMTRLMSASRPLNNQSC